MNWAERQRSAFVVISALAVLLVALAAPARTSEPLPPGVSLDAAYAPPSGIARETLGAPQSARALAVHADTIYAVGEAGNDVLIVARASNGAYETAFSGDGRMTISIASGSGGSGRDAATALAVMPDGRLRILASRAIPSITNGIQHTDIVVIGLLPSGAPDPGFGDVNGRVTLTVDQVDSPTGIALDPAGRVAITGSARPAASGDENAFVAMLEANGAPAAFGTGGKVILDRAPGTRNEQGRDIAFRDGGGVWVLSQAATQPGPSTFAYEAIVQALTEQGGLDPAFSEDGEVVLGPGEPDTVPGSLIVHGGRLWVAGSTHIGQDIDAFIARLETDGSAVSTRRFDMRGGLVAADAPVISSASDLAVLPGERPTLVISGSVVVGNDVIWAVAAFNGLDGPLENMGFGDLVVPTESSASVQSLNALASVVAGDGWLAAVGSIASAQSPGERTFATTRLLIDADKRCDLALGVVSPLEMVFRGLLPATARLRVTNVGARPCAAGMLSVPAPYRLGDSGTVTTGALDAGAVFEADVTVAYEGPRRRDDVLPITVRAAGDPQTANDTQQVPVSFAFCDVGLKVVGHPRYAPTEGGRLLEFSLGNIGSAPCRNARVRSLDGARMSAASLPVTLSPGRSAAVDVTATIAAPRRPGRQVTLVAGAGAQDDVDAANDRSPVTLRLVGVGDSDARAPRSARRFSGTARPGKGPLSARSLRVRKVDVAIRRLGTRCRWLSSVSGRLRSVAATASRPCGRRPVWVRAKGTRRWHLTLRRALPPGRYVLLSRATIATGPFPEASFTTKDRNRVAFRVRGQRR